MMQMPETTLFGRTGMLMDIDGRPFRVKPTGQRVMPAKQQSNRQGACRTRYYGPRMYPRDPRWS